MIHTAKRALNGLCPPHPLCRSQRRAHDPYPAQCRPLPRVERDDPPRPPCVPGGTCRVPEPAHRVPTASVVRHDPVSSSSVCDSTKNSSQIRLEVATDHPVAPSVHAPHPRDRGALVSAHGARRPASHLSTSKCAPAANVRSRSSAMTTNVARQHSNRARGLTPPSLPC